MSLTGVTPIGAVPTLAAAQVPGAPSGHFLPIHGARQIQQPSLFDRLRGAWGAATDQLGWGAAAGSPISAVTAAKAGSQAVLAQQPSPAAPRATRPKTKKKPARKPQAKSKPRPKAIVPAAVAPQMALQGASPALGLQHGVPGVPALAGMPATSATLGFNPLLGMGTLPGQQWQQPAPEGPQVNATNQGGIAAGNTGGTQNVVNRNVFDSSDVNRSPYLSPWGGLGSPYVGWQDAYHAGRGTGIGGFFSRLFG